MKEFDIKDVPILLGLVLLCTGLAYYDWRIAAIVTGVILLVIGTIGSWRQ